MNLKGCILAALPLDNSGLLPSLSGLLQIKNSIG